MRKTLRVVIVPVVILVLAAQSFRLIFDAYVSIAGIVVPGEVIGKREAIEMPRGDSSRHVFEIRYRYQPLDARFPETASHPVDLLLYSRLHVGSPVRVRYSPSRLVRHMEGIGSALTDSSWFSRIRRGSETGREFGELAAFGAALLLAIVAYQGSSQSLRFLAGLTVATVLSAILLFGFIVFPILFWLWRGHRGKGYGWMLLICMPLSTALIYWRIPRPTPMPPGAQRDATAIVRQVRVVDQIWNSSQPSDEGSGQGIRQPFQMVDLEFTPEGATEPVHVLDRVDVGSEPGLSEGARVSVSYPLSNPRAGRIAGGNRTYARQALIYLLGLTYGVAAALALVVFPGIALVEKLLRSIPVLGSMIAPDEARQRITHLPADDPRRKALEAYLRRHDRK